MGTKTALKPAAGLPAITESALFSRTGILWRSSDRTLNVPMVEIPRALAFDLIRVLSLDDYLFTMPEADLDKDLHIARHEAHKERMKGLAEMISIELTDSDIHPTAEVMLRTLSLLYEGSALVGEGGVK